MNNLRAVASKLSKIFRLCLPPFLLGAAKVCAVFISAKFFLIYFEVFFFGWPGNF